MLPVILSHHHRFEVHTAGIFNDVNSYSELNNAIRMYGTSKGGSDTEGYRVAVGGAFEVFCEYFYRRYDTDVHIGVTELQDTSTDRFQVGYDFIYNNLQQEEGRIQTKWKGDSTHKFTRDELGTFSSILYEEGILHHNAILFTNLTHNTSEEKGSVFHFSWDIGARKQMRVFDQFAQNQFILRDPEFWNDLRTSLDDSCITEFVIPFTNRAHQDLMEENQKDILHDGGRVTQVCATGGGKSQCERNTVDYVHFTLNKRLTILVAPTIGLVNQHFNDFYKIGFFHKGVHAINFNTGSEPDYDDRISFTQPTDTRIMEAIFTNLLNDTSKHIHVTTTYKSLKNLTSLMDTMGIITDCVIFDEYQHLITQKVNDLGVSDMREYLFAFPAFSLLFYSASIKKGRRLCALDEEVFGPIVTNITYKYLREHGILVPKIMIKIIRIDSNHKITGLTKEMLEHAKVYEDLDIKAATVESAGVVIACEDAKNVYGQVNLVTFSERVNHCKVIGQSKVVQDRLSNMDLHVVHAGVPTNQRTKIYNHLRDTVDNVLLQHSCVTEGIDVTSFNAAVAIRSLGIIEMQQAIGRIVRAHPEDTKLFEQGLLSLDDPTGWIKYSATFYVLVDTDSMDEFADQMKQLLYKLQFAGLTEDDYEMAELLGSRHGVETPGDEWKTPIRTNADIGQLSLEDVIRRAQLEMEQEERMMEINKQVDEVKQVLSFDKMLDFC